MIEQVAGKIGKVRLKSNGSELKIIKPSLHAKTVVTLPDGKVTIEDFTDNDVNNGVRLSMCNFLLDSAKFELMLEER